MTDTNANRNPYQVMPDMAAEEFDALKADIAEHGVLIPIELDEDGNVLDGHHRLKACEELGITDYPTITRAGMTEAEKVLHAYTLNTARRHLTREQKAEAVKDLLRRDPSISDRKIAAAVGVTHPTVGKYRRQLEGGGQVVKLTTEKEPKLGRGTFTCCICGREAPALYVMRRDGRKVVNAWGYDPWPLQVDGDCCEPCNHKLTDIRVLLPIDVLNEHMLGPQWRELLQAAKETDEKLGHRGTPEEFEAEFERVLADRGIYYDATTDRYTRQKEGAQLLASLMTKAIDEAAERGDVATIEAIRDEAQTTAAAFANVCADLEDTEE